MNGVGHLGKDRDKIAVAQGEYGVQMHGRTVARELAGDDAVHLTAREQRSGQLPHRLRRGAFTHADQNRPVANGHDIAALQVRRAMVHHRIAIPHLRRPGEIGVKTVDGGCVQRLPPPRGPEHRVQRDTAVNPAGGVAGEDLVRQWRQQKILRSQHGGHDACRRNRQFRPVHAADQDIGQHLGRSLCRPSPQVFGQTDAHGIFADPLGQHPITRLRVGQRFDQEVAEDHHLNPPLAQGIDKGHVIHPRLFDPEHIVKQQRLAVGGGQPRHLAARGMHHDTAQLSCFGMNAIGGGHGTVLDQGGKGQRAHHDDRQHQQKRPDKAQPALIRHPADGKSAHDNR